MAQSLTFQLAEVVTYEGRPPNDVGGRDCLGSRALHRFYECADGGWLALVCERPEEAAGAGPRPGHRDRRTPTALTAPRDGALAEAIAKAFGDRPRDETVQALLAAGVPAAPALRGPRRCESEWLWENRTLERWTHPRLGDIIGVRAYADFSRSPGGFRIRPRTWASTPASCCASSASRRIGSRRCSPPARCSNQPSTTHNWPSPHAPAMAASP